LIDGSKHSSNEINKEEALSVESISLTFVTLWFYRGVHEGEGNAICFFHYKIIFHPKLL
jgi:hypothetical protein